MNDPITNLDRAELAEQALLAFSQIAEGTDPRDGELYDDPQTVLVDLLANLMHWAKLQPETADNYFEEALKSARMHFEAELEDETTA